MGEADEFLTRYTGRHAGGTAVFVECDARQQIAAVAESVSAMEVGDLFRQESRDAEGSGFLSFWVERKGAVSAVPAVDRGDSRICGESRGALMATGRYGLV